MAFGDVCFKCEERVPGCHGKCERYKAAKSAHDEREAAIRRARELDRDAAAVKARAQAKAMKRHNTAK